MLWRRYEKVHYLDCGETFLVTGPGGQRTVDGRLVPDGVHPNAEGMDRLGLCLDPTVAFLKMHPRAGEAKKFVDEVSSNWITKWPL